MLSWDCHVGMIPAFLTIRLINAHGFCLLHALITDQNNNLSSSVMTRQSDMHMGSQLASQTLLIVFSGSKCSVKFSIFQFSFRGRTWMHCSEDRDSCNCFLLSPFFQTIPHLSRPLIPSSINFSPVLHLSGVFISAFVSWLSQCWLSPWPAAWVPCWTQDVVLPI